MSFKITLKEAVEKHGSDGQKRNFVQNKGNLKTNPFNSLKKTLNRIYEGLEVHGEGKHKYFTYVKEKEEKSKREDGRVNNGKNQLPLNYEKMFPIMIIDFLTNYNVEKPLTVNRWLKLMGFISEDMFQIGKTKYKNELIEDEQEKLIKNDVIDKQEKYVLNDYVMKEIDRLQRHFMMNVEKLKKDKIIKHQSFTRAKCQVPEFKEYYVDGEFIRDVTHNIEYQDLSAYSIGQIAKISRDLQNKDEYKDLSIKEINFFRNRPIVQKYWKEYYEKLNKVTDEYGNRLYIVLTFEVHAFFISAGKNPVKKWLEKNHKEDLDVYVHDEENFIHKGRKDFHHELGDYVVDLATKRENRYIKENPGKFNAIDVGGKPKNKEIDFVTIQELMLKKKYATAYKKLQDYYSYKVS